MTVFWMAAIAFAGGGAWGLFAEKWYLWPAGTVIIFIGELLLAAALLLISCKAVDTAKPAEKDSPWFRLLAYMWTDIAVFLLQVRLQVTGKEKLPKTGRFLLVSNHLNDLDPVILMHIFKKGKLAFISKRENGNMFVVGKLMHKLSCQLINRENDREALKTILQCIDMLKKDRVSVAVFPEGYTSLDGMLHPYRSGVFKIAMKAKVPVVVCTVQNTAKIFGNAKRLRKTDVPVHLLGVITPEEYAGITAVELGKRVHKMMADDLGPDKVLPENP